MPGMGYEILLDRDEADVGVPRLELPDGFAVLDAAVALEELFSSDSALEHVAVVVGSVVVGGTSRAHVLLSAEQERAVGDGDGATLPGYSSQYELLAFVCRVCGRVTYRLHLDPREVPVCPDGHGALERVR
jgi:hypothetical protein